MSTAGRLIFISILLSLLLKETYGCNLFFGPSGQPRCIRLLGYFGYQWATCLSNSYIKSKSSGNHACVQTFAHYCYYQCEVEVNNRESGFVNSNCRCTPGVTPPPTTAPLPQWCMDPSGDKCSWYRECLEKVHPCQNHEVRYAITYGEKFCKLYEDRKNNFSPIAQKWIDNVRRCLQLQLVPYIRNFQQQTKCEEIKKAAFKSHDCCYLAGDSCSKQTGAPSVCDIPAKDWANIIWTIKGSLGDEFMNTMRSALKVGSNCLVNALDERKDRIIELHFNTIRTGREFLESGIKEIGIEISKQLRQMLLEKTYDWLYYVKDQSKIRRNTNDGLDIVLWIRARNEGRQHLNSIVNRILTGIQTRYFTKIFNDGSMVQLRTASSCQDLKCKIKTETVLAKIPPTTTTPPCSNCLKSSSITLFRVNIVLIILAFLVAAVSATIYE